MSNESQASPAFLLGFLWSTGQNAVAVALRASYIVAPRMVVSSDREPKSLQALGSDVSSAASRVVVRAGQIAGRTADYLGVLVALYMKALGS